METQNVKVTKSGGLGLSGILTIIFVIFKLLGKITWSWWWVLSPLWIGWSLAILLVIVLEVIKAIVDR